MPSHLHESLLLLFRNRPSLAAELMAQALAVDLPPYGEARIESAELTDVEPEFRADLVVVLYQGAQPTFGVVVEVQLRAEAGKRLTWPAYGALSCRRHACPTCVLVVTLDEATARWAAEPIALDAGSVFQPLVLGPSGVPVVTDVELAYRCPELAVLSAMAHGRGEPQRALDIALAATAASAGLEPERALLYYDMIVASLGEAAKEALSKMDPAKYEYQSDFARHYFGRGRDEGIAEGRAEGIAEVVLRLLEKRFGSLPHDAVRRVEAASTGTLEEWAERLLVAETLDEVFGADRE